MIEYRLFIVAWVTIVKVPPRLGSAAPALATKHMHIAIDRTKISDFFKCFIGSVGMLLSQFQSPFHPLLAGVAAFALWGLAAGAWLLLSGDFMDERKQPTTTEPVEANGKG